jgi:AraC-like DNA-binding protein
VELDPQGTLEDAPANHLRGAGPASVAAICSTASTGQSAFRPVASAAPPAPRRSGQAGPANRVAYSLAEVAAHAGFSDQSQFSHHFKRLIGVIPGQFQTRVRIDQEA